MNESSRLYPASMREQSDAAIAALRADNDALEAAAGALDAFINDDANRSAAFENLRRKMQDFRAVADALIKANDSDITDHRRLIHLAGSRDLDGSVIIPQLESNLRSRTEAEDMIAHYDGVQNSVSLLQRLNPFDRTYSNALRSKQRWESYLRTVNEIIARLEGKVRNYNEIEQATRELLTSGGGLRSAAARGLEHIREAAAGLPGSYDLDGLDAWRDGIAEAKAEFEGTPFDVAAFLKSRFPPALLEQMPELMEMGETELWAFLESLPLAGMPGFCAMGFDPVNMSTGNFIYAKEDIAVPGRHPLEFRRFYNSIGGTEGVLGAGWTHSYNIRLHAKEDGNVHIVFGDGHMETYEKTNSGSYTSPAGSDNVLSEKYGALTLTAKGGISHRFDRDGLLRSISDPSGNETKFEYGGSLLTEASSPSGSLMFEYDGRKRIARVSDHTGREAKFEYNGGLLTKATHPGGAEYSYGYDRDGSLSKITNPLGTDAIINGYDGHGRLIRQSFADGGECTLVYDKRMTTATEQNGNEIKYERDSRHRTVRTAYADSEERFEYNEDNRRTKHTDRNGNERRYEYDGPGNVTKATDPLGNETAIEYNEHSKPTKITAPNGGTVTNEYDYRGCMTASINPLGHAVKLKNDSRGNIARITLPDGSASSLAYDERGNITSVTDHGGNEAKYEYDSLNRAVRAIDPMGNETRFEYNAKGDIVRATNADGKSQSYEYDKSGKLIKLTDFIGGVTTYRYNKVGKLEETVNPSGGITKLEYDLMWNIISVTDPCGNMLRYEYDNHQRVTRTIDQEGHATNYEHDPNGNVTAVINPMGARMEIKYDALDRQTEIAEPDGAMTKLEYDALGNVTKITDPQGGKIVREYDNAGQLIAVTDQMGNTTSYAYTNLGQIETITDAMGGVTKYSYYPGGKLKAVMRPGGESENYEYDKNGNIVKITDNAGNVTSVAYNCLGRVVKTTDPLGHSKHFDYDAMGNITGITDENGNTAKYVYSPTGELIEVIDAMGHSTKYSYDKVGQMTKMEQYRIIDETYADLKQIEMQVTTWERNRKGDVIKKSTPLGGESAYNYDPLGNLISKTDEDGLETLYEYNLASKLEKVAYADGKTVELGYSPLRQLTQIKDWLGTTSIELDPIGRANKITDHDGNEVSYTWDALGRRESITYPDKSKVGYSYNASGRLEQIISETGVTKYSYDPAGRLKERIMPDDIVSQYISNPLGKLESLTHKKNGEILDSFRYSYDSAGNITQIEKHRSGVETDSGIFSYAYDPLGRLVEATNGQGSKQYRYDNLGNRIMSMQDGIETKYSYNAKNQLIRTTGDADVKEYGYDGRGNLTSILENGTITSCFTYSAANRMVEAITSKGKAEYEYNGFLKRVSTLESLQNSAADTPDPLSGVKYTLDLTKPYNDLLAIGDQRFVWGGELLMSEGSEEFAYLNDHLGSPIRLMDDKQNETLAYDEFGVPTVEASGNLHNPFGFTGYQPDAVSRMQYAQARYYVPTVGRFGAEDTVRDGMNFYAYCYSNPLRFVDRNGLWGEEVHYDDTKRWAIEAGFSEEDARLIAHYNNYTDKRSSGIDPVSLSGDQSYHFNRNISGTDSRILRSQERMDSAVDKWNESLRLLELAETYRVGTRMLSDGTHLFPHAMQLQREALQDLGHGLHALQDFYAHGQINANDGDWGFGHAVHNIMPYFSLLSYLFGPWASPDDIYRDWIGSGQRFLGPKGSEPGLRYQNTELATMRYFQEFQMRTERQVDECPPSGGPGNGFGGFGGNGNSRDSSNNGGFSGGGGRSGGFGGRR